uniref:CRB n=1 Tax=Arundo donax TaxID=35708 RepID=A0A0A9GZS2_ARUDO
MAGLAVCVPRLRSRADAGGAICWLRVCKTQRE